MRIETIRVGFSEEFDQLYEKYQSHEIHFAKPIPHKHATYDQLLFASIVKTLMDKRAEPEPEATAIFNKLTSHNNTVQRSAIRAVILMHSSFVRAASYALTQSVLFSFRYARIGTSSQGFSRNLS